MIIWIKGSVDKTLSLFIFRNHTHINTKIFFVENLLRKKIEEIVNKPNIASSTLNWTSKAKE